MKDPRYTLNSAEMQQIIEHAKDLKSQHAQRDADFAAYDEMYLMTWRDAASKKLTGQRITTSPDARDKVLGATRLLVATDPVFNVVGEVDTAEKIEKEVTRIWDQSGRIASCPVHYDMVTSGVLYGEMAGAINPTAELVAYLRKAKPSERTEKLYQKANLAMAERTAEITPFIVESWNPRNGYPERNKLGLTAYYRETATTAKQIRDTYGACPGYENAKPTDQVTLKVYYDLVFCAVWTDGGLIYMDEHGLPTIPIVDQIVDGSNLFDNPEYQRQPLLYGLAKSGLWSAQNLMLTVIYTAALTMGSKPHYLHVSPPNQPGKAAQFNYDDDVIELDTGEQFTPAAMNLIDASLREALQLAETKTEQSTIFSQALGSPADKNTTFSEISLLAQSGRLPLIGTQRRGGWGIAAVAEKILLMMRQESDYRKGTGLQAGDIPSNIQIEAKLEVKLPQDKLQQANLVRILATGEDPVVSKSWALQNILNEGQPEEMTREIWTEQASKVMFGQTMQQLTQMAQQQQRMQNGQQPGQQGMSPQSMVQAGPMMAPGQEQAIQGMPPQMAGMIPGAGQGMVPPEEQMPGGMNG